MLVVVAYEISRNTLFQQKIIAMQDFNGLDFFIWLANATFDIYNFAQHQHDNFGIACIYLTMLQNFHACPTFDQSSSNP
jgi:hypothetical protein